MEGRWTQLRGKVVIPLIPIQTLSSDEKKENKINFEQKSWASKKLNEEAIVFISIKLYNVIKFEN